MPRTAIVKKLKIITGYQFINENSKINIIYSCHTDCSLAADLKKNFNLPFYSVEQIKGIRFETIKDVVDFIMKQQEKLNIIVSGRSGVGKSSLLNYIVGEKMLETGIGEPVTKKYFEDITFISKETNISYRLLDTKGIEPTTTTEHEKQLIDYIRKKDKEKDFFEWMHTLFYCFAATERRIEPFEVNFIRKLQKHTAVIIVLTKVDLVSNDIRDQLHEQLKKELGDTTQVIPVCSVETRTRKGVSVPSGRENILKSSFMGLWIKIEQMLPRLLIENLNVSTAGTPPFVSHHARVVWKSHYSYNNPGGMLPLTLYGLRNLPTLAEFLEDLSEDSFTDVKILMDSISRVISSFFSNYPFIISEYKSMSASLQESVFNFYQKVNGKEARGVFNHKFDESLINFKEWIESQRSSIITLTRELYSEVHTIKNANLFERIFSIDHRSEPRKHYEQLRQELVKFIDGVESQLNTATEIYKAELHQYGQYFIRDIDCEFKGSDQQNEMNKNEKIYYNTLIQLLKDASIQYAERRILDSLRQTLAITEVRAGLIEKFARREQTIPSKYHSPISES